MAGVQKWQISRIHGLLSKIGVKDDKEYKAELVRQYTNGRETSTTRLSYHEAAAIIKDLESMAPKTQAEIASDVMRKKMLVYAYGMGIINPATGKADVSRVDNWCKAYGYLHKGLNEYTYEELPKLLTQYEQVYKSYLKSIKK